MRDRKVSTPIIDQLIAHAMREKVSLHVPGHHQGRTLFGPLAQWLGQATKWDVTELPDLDNLHHATGCIRASQALAAAHYGADHCFYSVNGATACVMAAIAASVQATGRNQVVILGPCHMSAWRGLVYADAGAVFVPSPWRQEIMTFGPPNPVQLANQLAQMRDVAAVFVTSPTYQGVVAPVAEIARVAHEYGVPLIVDEAHGAHFGLIDAFPRHSVEQGADIVIQSPHKTLPCLTQAAWVHVSGPLVEARLVEERLLFLETTSPSYLLLASLDGAQAWLHTEGAEAAQRTFECLQQYRSAHAPIGMATDPMREWIPTGAANESQRLETMLQERGIFIEFADASGVLAMFGFSQPAYEYGKFFEVLEAWRKTRVPVTADFALVAELYQLAGRTRAVLSPSEVTRHRRVAVPIGQAAGRILATPVAPYPPGVPALWPGQEIGQALVDSLIAWLQLGGTVVGIDEQCQLEVIE